MTLIHRFPGITVWKTVVDLTPILSKVSSERICLIRSRFFFIKELVRRFVHQSIYCWFRSNWNTGTPPFKFATTCFYGFSSLYSFPHENTVCITLHFIFWNHKDDLTQHMKLDCVVLCILMRRSYGHREWVIMSPISADGAGFTFKCTLCSVYRLYNTGRFMMAYVYMFSVAQSCYGNVCDFYPLLRVTAVYWNCAFRAIKV
jgi:hypothetical protein